MHEVWFTKKSQIGKNTLKTSRLERLELYKDHDTQVFLDRFLTGEISELQPVFDATLGYRYPTVEAIVGGAQHVEAFLNRLCEAGILERKLFDKVIYCPKCKTASISVHFCCPYCKSFDVQRSSLIEHVKCGYMDVEGNFQKGSKLVCPKCHEELKKPDVDHRQAGIWCSCKECGKSFDIPISLHFCRDCHGNFTFEDVLIKDAHVYRLKEEVKEEAGLGWVLIGPVKEFLIREGFKVEGPAFIKGKSGAKHFFDIVACKTETTQKPVVIDLATSAEDIVSEQPVIALFAKVFDVSPDKAYLIAVPKLNENGKKIAELYNIQIIEAKNQKEVVSFLREKMLGKT
jgi:hypothetical protein